jgi:SET domain-containing protein
MAISVVVKKSRIGKGLFATRRFTRGEMVLPIIGRIVHWKELYRRGGTFQNNTFRFDAEHYLSPRGEIGEFINHSCEPSARVTKRKDRLYLVAISTIRPGEEIFFDYSTNLAADDIWTMKCRCGALSCRKIIRAYTKLPSKLRQYYLKRGIIPRYIVVIG